MIKELTAGLDAATTAADSMRNFTEVTIATKFRGGEKKKRTPHNQQSKYPPQHWQIWDRVPENSRAHDKVTGLAAPHGLLLSGSSGCGLSATHLLHWSRTYVVPEDDLVSVAYFRSQPSLFWSVMPRVAWVKIPSEQTEIQLTGKRMPVNQDWYDFHVKVTWHCWAHSL